jgi:hypothetical protein
MSASIKAGFAYFALVFALGFILGTARVLWLVPRLGETVAVLVELPVMLCASWIACGWLIGHLKISQRRQKAVMGALAFTLLIAAEAGLGVFAFGQPFVEWMAELFRMPGILGLTSQIAFALMPLLRR